MKRNLYRLPTKLRKRNVFTGACHSVHRVWVGMPGPGSRGWVYQGKAVGILGRGCTRGGHSGYTTDSGVYRGVSMTWYTSRTDI